MRDSPILLLRAYEGQECNVLCVFAESGCERLPVPGSWSGGWRKLQLAEFIYEQPAVGEVEYTFKHALTQEEAYGSLLVERN